MLHKARVASSELNFLITLIKQSCSALCVCVVVARCVCDHFGDATIIPKNNGLTTVTLSRPAPDISKTVVRACNDTTVCQTNGLYILINCLFVAVCRHFHKIKKKISAKSSDNEKKYFRHKLNKMNAIPLVPGITILHS